MVVKPGSRVHDVAGGCSGPFLLFTKRQYTEQLRDTQGEQLLDMLRSQQHLRLKSLGFSDRNIARSCSVSRNTVRRVIDKATEMDISWPLDFDMTDGALEELLFPSDKSATDRRLPDYNYIRKELLRNGVTKKLLWIEYCEECRQAGEEPLMYSQFCEYIRRDEQKRRATMHIPRKPGEQIEVDWAGDPAHIIAPNTGELTDCWLFVGVMTYSQYTFVEAFMNERTGNWIKANVHMFEFFGGTAPMIVADNCTIAVDHKKSDCGHSHESVVAEEASTSASDAAFTESSCGA